jgi:hypothetical protein
VHGLGDFGFQIGIEKSHEAAGNDESLNLVSPNEVGGAGRDHVRLAFQVMIGILQQAEPFMGDDNFGRQHLLQAFKVWAIGSGRR